MLKFEEIEKKQANRSLVFSSKTLFTYCGATSRACACLLRAILQSCTAARSHLRTYFSSFISIQFCVFSFSSCYSSLFLFVLNAFLHNSDLRHDWIVDRLPWLCLCYDDVDPHLTWATTLNSSVFCICIDVSMQNRWNMNVIHFCRFVRRSAYVSMPTALALVSLIFWSGQINIYNNMVFCCTPVVKTTLINVFASSVWFSTNKFFNMLFCLWFCSFLRLFISATTLSTFPFNEHELWITLILKGSNTIPFEALTYRSHTLLSLKERNIAKFYGFCFQTTCLVLQSSIRYFTEQNA